MFLREKAVRTSQTSINLCDNKFDLGREVKGRRNQ